MPSLGDLVDEVINTLHGYTTDVPLAGSLVGSITESSTELALDFGDQPGAGRPNGLVEIGSELIYVTHYNPSTGVATVPTWGRGFRGTTAADHDAGDLVLVRPRYPRKQVADAINAVVRASCPPLFSARDLTPFDTDAFVDLGYTLPTDTIRVLRVEATEIGPEFLVCRRVLDNWTVRNVAGTQLLELDRNEVFQTVQVTVAAEPGAMTTESADFVTTTGLPVSCSDLVVFGAVSRLILGAELARQQASTVEAAARNVNNAAGSATTISRYFMGLYTNRLDAERDRLQAMYPLTLLRRG